MRSLISSCCVLALAAAGALAAPASAAPAPNAKAGTIPTAFALAGSGFGTKARGGDIPADSDTTAAQALGCTNRAGTVKENHVLRAELPGFGTAYGVTTDVWTKVSKAGTVSSYSRNSTARVVLGEESLGSVEINGIKSLSRAFHTKKKGFQASTKTVIGSLTHTSATGEKQELSLPTPNQPVEVPGLVSISVGKSSEKTSRNSAKAMADAVNIKLLASTSKLQVAHSRAVLWGGIKSGLFGGRSSGIQSTAADENLSIGHQPLSIMPCQGTDGDLHTKSLAHIDLGEDISLRNVSSRQQSDQTGSKAEGFELGRVGLLDINYGELLIRNVVGKANVVRTSGDVRRTANGTEVGTVKSNGETREFPDSDVLEIPGVARLERSIVDRSDNGLSVIALRVTLLDGSGAVLNLGSASLRIRGSGR